jgi:hypothetical protein
MDNWQHFSIIWALIVGLGISRSLLFIGLYIEYKIKVARSNKYSLVDSPLLLIGLVGTILFSVMFWWIMTPAAYLYQHPEIQMSVWSYLLLFFHGVVFFIILDLYTPELEITNEQWDLDSHYWMIIKPVMFLMALLFLISMLLIFCISTDIRPSWYASFLTLKKVMLIWPPLLGVSFAMYKSKSLRIHFFSQSVICFVIPIALAIGAPKYGMVDRDGDMDGVINTKDNCPDTIPSQVFDVDLYGCSPEQNERPNDTQKQ